jgi:SAM-dependent methyltransferase
MVKEKGFRKKYSQGVPEYYTKCSRYSNPHSIKFDGLIKKLLLWLPYNLYEKSKETPVLDLACGSGEVTKVLVANGIGNVVGLDPFLAEQFASETGKSVFNNSFEDICRGVVPLAANYSIVICSYALHLCGDSLLPLLLDSLKNITSYLCVITPHGLPLIPEKTGWIKFINFKYGGIKVYVYSTLLSCCGEEVVQESSPSSDNNSIQQQPPPASDDEEEDES